VVAVSDDDWFERAFRDDESDSDDAEEREDHDEPSGERTGEDEPRDERTGEDEPRDERTGEDEPGGDENGSGAESDPDDATRTETGNGPSEGDADSGRAPAEPEDSEPQPGDDGGSPFDEDFASALQDAPEPGAESGQPPGTAGGPEEQSGDDPFGDDPFGGGNRGESPFGGGGDDEFGFGDFGGNDPEAFDEEEFDSDLERLDVGIEGLDQMILGGVPCRSLMVAIGSAGTGKTTFGLQFLNHGLQQGEDGVYITLEESYDRIISTADEKGWGFGEYVDDDRLAVVDIDPIEMANSLDSIQNDLPNLIEEFGADRLVLDSVSLLEMMYESAPRRRSQVFGFARALKKAGITILLTSEADRDHAYASRFGIVEYLADAVFVLQYVRPSDFQETRLAIEIQKIRDANHSRETKPYDLTDEGISVYRQANIF